MKYISFIRAEHLNLASKMIASKMIASLSVLILLPISASAIEVIINDRIIYAFSDSVGTLSDNQVFCSNLGMELIGVQNEAMEDAIKNQKNRFIDWIWINATFRQDANFICSSGCCNLQMEMIPTRNGTKYRVHSCSRANAYSACFRSLNDLGGESALIKMVENSVKKLNSITHEQLKRFRDGVEDRFEKLNRTQSGVEIERYEDESRSVRRYIIYVAVASGATFLVMIILLILKCVSKKAPPEELSVEASLRNVGAEECGEEPHYSTPRLSTIADTNL